MKQLVLFGRIFYTAVFLISVPSHFSESTVLYAASQGVPMAPIAVPLAGIIALLGGLSIMIGFRPKEGAWLIILYLVPVTLLIHKFWDVANPAMASLQQIQFMKNVSLLGAALLIAHFGSGPMSLDGWAKRRAHDRRGTKMIDLTWRRK
jgi:putative oxidoreductase